jgi:uncharacterized protein (TIGR02271 family)
VGVFEDRSDAERAVNELRRAGFRDDQIGFAGHGEAPEGSESWQTAGPGEAGEGAAKGAVGGGILGGILGALATGLIPGIGPVIAGGLLAGILGGAAVGAVGGGVLGALVGSLGVPEEEAEYYDSEFRGGRTLVTVKADGRDREARDILHRLGAYDVERRRGAAPTGTAAGERVSGEAESGEQLQLREEELRVEKEAVETGRVTLGKDVVTERKSMDVPVTREEVYIERTPVDRPSDRPISEGQHLEVPIREERVEVTKEPHVYEEVGIGKHQVTETEHVAETVRREVADIDTEGDVDVRGDVGVTGTRSWDEVGSTYRQEWERRYGTSGMRWHDVEPYRRYGYEMGHDPRYRSGEWSEVEPRLRSDYAEWSRSRGYTPDESAWDRLKDQAREAWEETRQSARR